MNLDHHELTPEMKTFKDLHIWANVLELHPCTRKAAMTVSQQHSGEKSSEWTHTVHVTVTDTLESSALLYLESPWEHSTRNTTL